MREVRRGLRYWTAPHPDWNRATDWPEEVGCVYYEAADALALIDPLLAFYVRPHRALVVAELLMGIDGELRVCPSPALQDRNEFESSLLTLLDWPIDHVLVGHGEPVIGDGAQRIRDALRRFAATR